MNARAYHEPEGDPCVKCGQPPSRHWVRHIEGCTCACNHRGPKEYQKDTRTNRKQIRTDSRTTLSRKYWVGVDGEGMGRNPHRYIFLAYSDATGKHSDCIRAQKGLATTDCFDFLLSIPSDARAAGFYLGYDWTKILTDMPARAIYHLLRPELRRLPTDEGGGTSKVCWRGYKLDFKARAMSIWRGDNYVKIWDVGTFFQSTFVKTLEDWGIGGADLPRIKEMKNKRNVFTYDDDIEGYCLLECRKLAELCTDLESAHKDAGLPLTSFHGPGATASVALRSMGIQKKRGKIPRSVASKACYAFFGGRFEHSTIGKVGDCYGDDIVSAYPYEAYRLPCLEHGVWEESLQECDVERNPSALVSFAVSDCGNEQWGPLPCRMHDGSIVFARGGFSGHVWGKEYLEACKHWPGIHFKSAWLLKSDCQCQPFSKMLEWFLERERIGKDGKGKAIKLALNSCYGKLAQSVGKPRYRSIVWAGMITSGTRARLLERIGPDKDAIVATATDGLTMTRPIETPPPPLSCRLGSWERKFHPNTVLVRPGIYWSDDQIKARGLGTKALRSYRSRVMYAIAKGHTEAFTGKADVFFAARQSVYRLPSGRIKRSKRYGEWIRRPNRIRLTPLPKRNPDWSLRMLDDVDSQPYGKKNSEDAVTLKALENLLWGQP